MWVNLRVPIQSEYMRVTSPQTKPTNPNPKELYILRIIITHMHISKATGNEAEGGFVIAFLTKSMKTSTYCIMRLVKLHFVLIPLE